MRYMAIVLLALTAAFVYGTPHLGAEVVIALEAELADIIEEPMIIADDENDSSNGEYIWAEGAPATGGGGAGYAEFIINIPEPGDYALWGRVIAWDGNSDSFWVVWQPADPNEDAQATQNTEFRWGVQQGAAWHLDRINHWLDGGTFEREWEFDKAGETVLRIGVREDATKIDAVFVTTPKADEGAMDGRPNDKDRKIQIEGLDVKAQGKATTTWGSLKKAYQ